MISFFVPSSSSVATMRMSTTWPGRLPELKNENARSKLGIHHVYSGSAPDTDDVILYAASVGALKVV